ncbi:MAG: type I glyceraldehyde-3-phosphate dehydrogenase [Rhodospirillales bacterium]|jgi:glyceraldehyde 3-phosphate dehydrogenase|nr:type I glyceraldehyde-3-phosphate dehydrogenase [Rhodospirillales bacterium]MDG4604419.1 type I glyceraldehyde-3-phosphate dehydrogenase [Defluviicoccus sp.]MDG4610272.1 type I glyceraldehyde-3-phosphate dehydrogenase [Defluviicoccus sp.]HOT82360.1 type I glyceraldehyde-3-phosphate dehydrogenase [Candidatus Defluviicoccus seviourii]
MAVRVAINGFGRIGRLAMRAAMEAGRNDVDFVAINDLGAVNVNAHLLKYDSVHGTFPGEVSSGSDSITVNGKTVKVLQERDPTKLPWKEMGVDVVYECTGIFTDKEKAAVHLGSGAPRVLVSAPSKGADKTIVYGVNQKELTKDDKVVSNASCTTNCLAPPVYVLDKALGVERGYMTTIHSYTGDQRIIDTLHKDLRRARGAALSMIPTTTGAARAVGLVLPHLKGKLDGAAIRVPTPNVSVVDLVFITKKSTTVAEVNGLIEAAANGELKGILGYCTEPLVSIDFNHDQRSSIFDSSETQVIDGNMVRILTWYDNEWGFSNRMSDTATYWASI